MKIHEHLDMAIKELQNPSVSSFNFSTSSNGIRFITNSIFEDNIEKICKLLMENDSSLKRQLRIEQLHQYVKKTVIDCTGENIFKHDEINKDKRFKIKILKNKLDYVLMQKIISTEITMYYPSDTVPLPDTFSIGPVKFLSPLMWVDGLTPRGDFNPFGEKTIEIWKDNFKKNYIYKRKFDYQKPNEFDITSETLRGILGNDNIVLKVSLKNLEPNRAWEHGRMICKTALDGLSFIFNDDRLFFRQVMQDCSKPSTAAYKIFEHNGYLIKPGMSLTEVISPYPHEISLEILRQKNILLNSISKIVSGISLDVNATHPKMSMRCSTALEWFSESIRERNDYIAISKMCISLDVLCDGGKSDGITKLCSSLLKISPDDKVPFFKDELTLISFVKNAYEKGRSHIIHGNRFDRSDDYKNERKQIRTFCYNILYRYFIEFLHYDEDDMYQDFFNYIVKSHS